MRKRLTAALAVLGLLLVAAGAVIRWVVAPMLVKAPLDIRSTTVAEGISKVFVLTAQRVETVDVVATRVVTGDKAAGTGTVAVYDETLCLVAKGTQTAADGCATPDKAGFIQKTTDRVAFDRVKATAVPGARFKANVDGDAKIAHVGLDYTFPIDTQKRTYQLFDTTAGKAFPASYSDTETISGLTVYKFVSHVPATDIQIEGLIPGVYNGTTTVWVEPTTGVIVKGAQRIVQKFKSNDQLVFDGTLTFTPDTVRKQAAFANEQLTKINVIRIYLPLGVGLIGILLLAIAWFRGRRQPARAPREDAAPRP
jgi:hypothetical protein